MLLAFILGSSNGRVSPTRHVALARRSLGIYTTADQRDIVGYSRAGDVRRAAAYIWKDKRSRVQRMTLELLE